MRGKGNLVTSMEGKRKSSYIRGRVDKYQSGSSSVEAIGRDSMSQIRSMKLNKRMNKIGRERSGLPDERIHLFVGSTPVRKTRM